MARPSGSDWLDMATAPAGGRTGAKLACIADRHGSTARPSTVMALPSSAAAVLLAPGPDGSDVPWGGYSRVRCCVPRWRWGAGVLWRCGAGDPGGPGPGAAGG